MRKVRCRVVSSVAIVGFLVYLLSLAVMPGNAFAASTEGGGWVSPGGDTGGSGGSGGGDVNCDGNDTSSVKCTGKSWIFYKSQKSESEAKVIPLYIPFNILVNTSGSNLTVVNDLYGGGIPKICAEHTEQNGGFWHYGINGMGKTPANGREGGFSYVISNWSSYSRYANRYSVDVGSWGHWGTIPYGTYDGYAIEQMKNNVSQTINDENGEVFYRAGGDDNIRSYIDTKPFDTNRAYTTYVLDGSGNPKLDENGNKEPNYPLLAYRKACAYSATNDRDKADCNNATSIPKGTSAFCYWDGMDETKFLSTKLTAKYSTGDTIESINTSIREEPNSKTETIGTKEVEKGSYITLEFVHGLYADQADTNVEYEITMRADGLDSGSVRIKRENNGTFITNRDTVTDSGAISTRYSKTISGAQYFAPYDDKNYLKKNNYTIYGDRVGSFNICEVIKLSSGFSTGGCINLKVTEDPPSGGGGNDVIFSRSTVSVYDGAEVIEADTGLVGYPCKITRQNGFHRVSDCSNATRSVTANNGQPIRVLRGDVIDITFTHDVYSMNPLYSDYTFCSYSDGSVQSCVTPALAYSLESPNTNGIYIIETNARNGYGYTEVGWRSGQYFVPNMTGDHFNTHNYELQFNNLGSYLLCDSMSIRAYNSYYYNNTSTTSACAKIEVIEAPILTQGCASWTYLTNYATSGTSVGWNEVLILGSNGNIIDARASGYGWKHGQGESDSSTVYAKPGDKVTFIDCYFPGLQKSLFRQKVTSVHGAHNSYPTAPYSTRNTNVQANDSVFGSWTNLYTVRTTKNSPNMLSGQSIPSSATFDPGFTRSFDKNDRTPIQEDKLIYTVTASDTGKYFMEQINSGSPSYVSRTNHGRESWICTWPNYGGGCCSHHTWDVVSTWYTDKDGDIVSSGTEGASKHETYGWVCDEWLAPCYTSHQNDYITQSRDNSSDYDRVWLKVPYNFTNSASLQLGVSASTPVYAGETVKVNEAKVNVNTKFNSVLGTTYATKVDGAEARLIAYVSSTNSGNEMRTGTRGTNLCSLLSSSQCSTVKSTTSTTLNSNSNLSGSTESFGFNNIYNVFDANAGNYMCFRMAVYPSASGGDTNMNPNGDGQWYLSAPQCRIIAKKPSFQVYGGSLYSAGSIKTSRSLKRNLLGIYGYTPMGSPSNTTVFGSWVEQSVVSLGAVTLLSSGASTGLNNTAVGSGGPDASDNFCKNRTPLSFANYSSVSNASLDMSLCPNSSVTGFAEIAPTNVNRESLIDFFSTGSPNVPAGISVNLNNANHYSVINSATGVKIRYTHSSGNLTLNGATIGASTTHVVRANGNVTINGNISYTNNTFGSASEIPKLIIYARNIVVDCRVTTLDAILIAENNVNTCNSGNINSSLNSNQLNIRGMVITNTMSLNRTYGAATGRQSGTPAETVNYDTSAILWGRFMSGAAESDTLVTTYQHELAPRY